MRKLSAGLRVRRIAYLRFVFQGLIESGLTGKLNTSQQEFHSRKWVTEMPSAMLKIGAVSYLNSKPLIEGLESDLHSPSDGKIGGELVLDLPSRLADRLAAGELDAALIPSVEAFRHPECRIVSNACIACHGPVWSVRLLFRTPPHRVESLALDEGSRTSAALSQILLQKRFGIRPKLRIMGMEEDVIHDTRDDDAVLVIGDRAMSPDLQTVSPSGGVNREVIEQWDLGEEWLKETGLPFVFAMWVERQGIADSARLAHLLEQARDRGVAKFDELTTRYAPAFHLSLESCNRYFRQHLGFYLDEPEQAGLAKFRELYSTLLLPHENQPLTTSDRAKWPHHFAAT